MNFSFVDSDSLVQIVLFLDVKNILNLRRCCRYFWKILNDENILPILSQRILGYQYSKISQIHEKFIIWTFINGWIELSRIFSMTVYDFFPKKPNVCFSSGSLSDYDNDTILLIGSVNGAKPLYHPFIVPIKLEKNETRFQFARRVVKLANEDKDQHNKLIQMQEKTNSCGFDWEAFWPEDSVLCYYLSEDGNDDIEYPIITRDQFLHLRSQCLAMTFLVY